MTCTYYPHGVCLREVVVVLAEGPRYCRLHWNRIKQKEAVK